MIATIGKPIDRKDARLKVTGAARYAAEFPVQNMAYAFPVRSTIGNGRITSIDTTQAEKSVGVIAAITHKNAVKLKPINVLEIAQYGTIPAENLPPLQDDKIHYVGQYIGLIVAETYEQARQAAKLVKVVYQQSPVAVELEKEKLKGEKPEKFFGMEDVQIKRGDSKSAFENATAKITQDYSTPTQNHHPMETHASIASWNNGKLVIYDATQAVKGSQAYLASSFGLKLEDVRLMSPFVGGGFGCKGLIWQNPTLAAMAAQVVKRPVKIVLTRQMMQTNAGRRGETLQKVSLSASKDGKLTAIKHDSDTYTNLTDFFEPSGLTTRLLYACPNIEISHNVAKLNVGTPTPMRAPGESPGTFALESAMDELAHELKIDPIQIRLTNHADVEPQKNLAWSIKNLKDCYRIGAEKFGWSKRNSTPRQTRDGRFLIGYGMATATYPGYRQSASARVRINVDGSIIVMSATQDIGTGTYTVLAQVAADALNVDVRQVKVELGDSSLPAAPTSGGSQSVASVAPAVQAACENIKKRIAELSKKDASSNLNYAEILKANKLPSIEECVTTSPEGQPSKAPCSPYKTDTELNADQQKYAFQSFGAQFAEVKVDEDLGTIRVSRFTSVHDIGRVLNAKTARSQIYSGVIMGIGATLMEETLYDNRNARPVVRTLGDYHVPVNLDVPTIDVHLLNIPDPHLNVLGVRGVGEIGITGVSAAIANAVFNATGKRLRNLPFTPDKLI